MLINKCIREEKNTNKYPQHENNFEKYSSVAIINKQYLLINSIYLYQFQIKENGAIKVTSQLNATKIYQSADTSTKIKLNKLNKGIFRKSISGNFKRCIGEGELRDELMHADVIPVHKKKQKCVKKNISHVIILEIISKTYEKLT